MILKIDQTFGVKKNRYAVSNKEQSASNKQMHNPVKSAFIDSNALQSNYMLSFGAKSDRQKTIEKAYTSDAVEVIENATKIAKAHGHTQVTEVHIQKSILDTFNKYLEDIAAGEKIFDIDSSYRMPLFFSDGTTEKIYQNKEERNLIKPLVEEEIKELAKALKEMPKPKVPAGTKPQEINMSSKLLNALYDDMVLTMEEGDSKPVVEGTAFARAIDSMNEGKNPFRKFLFRLSESVMVDTKKPSERISLNFYKDKAKNVLKNVSLGSHIVATYDNAKMDSDYIMDTIASAFDSEKALFQKDGANPPKLTVFNKNANEDFVVKKLRALAKDTNTNHVIVLDKNTMVLNTPRVDAEGKTFLAFREILPILKEPPKNIKMIFVESKDTYTTHMANPAMQEIFTNFNESSFPAMSAEEVKKAFRDQPLLFKKIDSVFSPQAISKTVEAGALLEGGITIEKIQKLMKKIAAYNLGKKEISEKDVKNYVVQVKDMFKSGVDESGTEIIFDTGKKLKDLIGKSATKKEAESIVKQIKRGALGTKGAIIYSQDGSVGGGRTFVAKTIAGELGAPFMEINAMDFGTEKVDVLGGEVISPERTIKKIFSMLATQAEANSNKTAVLYINNFEYLSMGEQISEYYIKAMAQLIREMDGATKKGLNMLVLGSVSDADYVGEAATKSLKFIDKIEVESPSHNIEARTEILQNLIAKKKLKLGANDEEAKALLKTMAETTNGFPFVYLANLADKVKTVAFENGHKNIKRADITEAYLQLTTGRPASGHITPYSQKIVTTHEWGHAFTLERMHDIAEKQNIPWHLGDKVNFITLDPRGQFGGAMFSKQSENEEHCFEKIFTDLVCDFGGHSTEKHFYNIDGSWGITSDIEMATSQAEKAVGIMGQGGKFGKKSISGMGVGISQKSLQVFEGDRDALLDNARLVSDLLVKSGTDLGKEFTEKYAKLVGTGECIVQGDVFRAEMDEWLAKQSPAKLNELEEVDKTVLDIIEAAKKGVKFDINSKTVSAAVKKLYKSVAYVVK